MKSLLLCITATLPLLPYSAEDKADHDLHIARLRVELHADHLSTRPDTYCQELTLGYYRIRRQKRKDKVVLASD